MQIADRPPFVCSECASRHPAAGDCPCGAGPLFDIRDPAIADALREDDQRRSERAKQRNIWIGVFLGMATGGAIFAAIPSVILQIPLPIPFANPLKVIAMMIGLTAIAVFLLDRVLRAKPRFPELSPLH
ncbi:MAG: hypothetical protein U0414_06145 [Polyangiaceae bacterium]